MGEKTGIAWCDHTWNPFYGCERVSAGCDQCYADRDMTRYGLNFNTVTRAKPATFNSPLKWKSGRVFTCSWSDWFIADADPWRDEAWQIIRRTPHLTYQILTKRPVLIKRRLPKDWGDGYPNVWLGVSTENQEMADARIPILLETPARVRFLSIEPLLERIDLDPTLLRKIDWAIIGGESGSKARPCNIDWIRSLLVQTAQAGVATFVKQLGSNALYGAFDDTPARRFPISDRHGADPSEFPDDIRVRQFPDAP